MAMNPGMKMMLMQRMDDGPRRSEYGGGDRRMIGYERNEPRGMGGYGPPSNGMPWYGGYGGNYGGGYEPPEDRRRSPRTGRFIRGGDDRHETRMGGYDRSHMDGDEEDWGDDRRYAPRGRGGNSYGDIYAEGKIYAPGAMNRPQGDMKRHMRELDEDMAYEWVERMQNADGSAGPHYKLEQTEQWRSTNCMDCDKWEFFVAVNMMYSDYCKVAEKMNVSKLDFYGHMAKAFLHDEDAGPHKLMKYMEEVVG